MIEQIVNGESGLSVRTKLNALIDAINAGGGGGPTVEQGTWTPVFSGSSNAGTPLVNGVGRYIRIGNLVQCTAGVRAFPVNANVASFRMTLPVARTAGNFQSVLSQCAGVLGVRDSNAAFGNPSTFFGGYVEPVTNTQLAVVRFAPANTSTHTMVVQIMYSLVN